MILRYKIELRAKCGCFYDKNMSIREIGLCDIHELEIKIKTERLALELIKEIKDKIDKENANKEKQNNNN